MHKTRSFIINLVIIIVLVILGIKISEVNNLTGQHSKLITTVSYICNAGKTINASFYDNPTTTTVKPGERPVPTGSADIKLDDGREMTLEQTLSADGARYANPDESFVFWSKGNGALVLENNEQKSFIGCVSIKSDPGGLSEVYQDGELRLSLRYPSSYTLDTDYKYQEFGPGKDISGVKFTIPSSIAEGTNLAKDSYISIESIPNTKSCSAGLFLDDNGAKAIDITDGGTSYSVASSTGAGAGNRYEETVYALPYTNPCIGIRYFIHSNVIENYPTGAMKEFDKTALINQFDQIRKTLTLAN